MNRKSTLRQGWRSLWELRPHHDTSAAMRLLVASLLAVALALGLMSFVAIFGRVSRAGWWWASLLPNIGICLCIVHSMFGVLRVAERVLPASLMARMADVRDIRAGMALSSLALAGIIVGMTIGFTIVPILVGFNVWGMFVSLPAALTKFAVFLLFVMAANWAWWRSRLRQQQLQGEVTAARLRLLQGQIEPHLLFNTLANIHSLMDYDPPRAKRMVETFSTYLRASLSQLRQADSTLATRRARPACPRCCCNRWWKTPSITVSTRSSMAAPWPCTRRCMATACWCGSSMTASVWIILAAGAPAPAWRWPTCAHACTRNSAPMPAWCCAPATGTTVSAPAPKRCSTCPTAR